MQRSGDSAKVGCRCVQLEGVVVLEVGRVEHVLGSGILQIFYTPTLFIVLNSWDVVGM